MQIHRYAEWKASASSETVFIPWAITGDFSESTRNKAMEAGIRLINGIDFAGMLADSGIGFLTDN